MFMKREQGGLMRTKKIITRSLIAVVCAIIIVCGFLLVEQRADETLTYSNLLDADSQEMMRAGLLETGIGAPYVETVQSWVQDYNQTMAQKDELIPFAFEEGFRTIWDKAIYYGDFEGYIKKWSRTHERADAFCRVFATYLLRDSMQVGNPLQQAEWGTNEGEYFEGDLQVLSEPFFGFSEEMLEKYFTIFHPVMLNAVPEQEALAELIARQWEQRGVTFQNEKASLMTVWGVVEWKDALILENLHAGILLDTSEGLLFVEKTDPWYPYQITKFNTAEHAARYMMDTVEAMSERYGEEVPMMVVMRNGAICA